MRTIAYFSTLLASVAHIGLVCSAPAPAPYLGLTIVEGLPAVPQGWHQGPRIPASHILRLRIALKQDNAFAFEQHVIDISTPGHPSYGKHMQHDEIKTMLRPKEEASRAVLGWLASQGVPPSAIEDDGDWINFNVPAIDAERILNTQFHIYSNSVNKARRTRTLRYSVPEKVAAYIHMIQPTTRFGQLKTMRSTISEAFKMPNPNHRGDFWGRYGGSGLNATFCNTTITPQCLRALYDFGPFVPEKNSKIGVCGYLNEYAKFNDFTQFTTTYAPYAAKENFTYISINGGLSTQNDNTDPDIEANLDVQYAYPLSYPTEGLYYSTGGLGELVPDNDEPDIARNQNEPYLDFLHYIVKLPDDELPATLSTSYGEDEQSIPESYTNMTCSLFAQLGARGVSVIFSSGDTGVGSACQSNDGKNTTRFLPIFPASCPFVTSVGGTWHVEPEEAIYFSSGGFSDRFARPAYQDDAVGTYLSNLGDTWKGLYNPQGRGFPDVAAQAYNFTFIDGGGEGRVGGTSAAAPVFAAVIANMNSHRISLGRRPLGFLNPFIYSVGYKGLTDITTGGSTGCTGTDQYSGVKTPFVPGASWRATEGWDPVTGLGTPLLQELLHLSARYGPEYEGRYGMGQ